jgi:hypothetical protein
MSLAFFSKYASDVYVAHIDFADEDSCFMLTTSKIIKIRSSKLRVLWVIPFYELTKLSLETEVSFSSSVTSALFRIVQLILSTPSLTGHLFDCRWRASRSVHPALRARVEAVVLPATEEDCNDLEREEGSERVEKGREN